MKAKEVLKLLKVSRPTLSSYVKNGRVLVRQQPNGFYDYNKESVYAVFDKELVRTSVIYARVSTPKQKLDLENQVDLIKSFCCKNGVAVSDIYKDIGSGINFDRKEFQRLLNDIIERKIDVVYISYKDRLSRISYKMFENLFLEFDCRLVVLNEIDDEKTVEKEIFNEIIGLIHCFAMKMYSNRRKEKLKLLEKELRLEENASC